MKNCYVVSNVLYDYTPGMVVIIAKNLEECRELFIETFYEDYLKDFDKAIAENTYKVFGVKDEEESRVVSWVHGGG